MHYKILFWMFTFLGVGLEIIGDVYFKRWVESNRNLMLVIGFIIYTIGAGFWAYSLKYESLSKAISVFTVLNLVVVALIGAFFFKEDITIINKIGIVFGIIGIFLIEWN